MESGMWRVVMGAAFGLAAMAGAAVAETAEPPAKPKCETAEINPVTGHVLCIKPLGAPVEAPPEEAKPPCKQDSRGQWTWSPNCEPTPEGM
jgi:hypothetical protein